MSGLSSLLATDFSPECDAGDFWLFMKCFKFRLLQPWLVWLFPCSYFKLLKFLGHISPAASPECSVRLLRVGWEDAHVTMPDILLYLSANKMQVEELSGFSFCWELENTQNFTSKKRTSWALFWVSQQNKIGKHRERSSRSWKLTSPKATKQIAAQEFGFVKDCVRLWELSML